MSKKKPAVLADAELAVMELLWEADVLTAPEIRNQLYQSDSASSTGTVQKLLQRLDAKGFIDRDRTHFVHFFRARITRQEYAGEQLASLAGKLTQGSLVPFITHLVDAKKLSAKERREIAKLLNKK